MLLGTGAKPLDVDRSSVLRSTKRDCENLSIVAKVGDEQFMLLSSWLNSVVRPKA
jgi:hypothetical protein